MGRRYLFAPRELVQESLGFSPFELVFGHTVWGALKLLKEKILCSEDDFLNLLQYVSDFHTTHTRDNLKKTQDLMKTRYNKTVSWKFEPSDKVLVLLPIPGKPLQARYLGLT